jgi:hypothetical protein
LLRPISNVDLESKKKIIKYVQSISNLFYFKFSFFVNSRKT